MTAAVVDASAIIAWLWPPQATEASDALRARLSEFELEAPFVFDWEVRNLILKLFGRGADQHLCDEALEELAMFNIELAEPTSAARIAEFAHATGLSLFDAAYLDQAAVAGTALISRDKKLISAATARQIPVFDLTRAEP